MEGIEAAALFIAKLLVIFKGKAYIFWDLKAASSLLERMKGDNKVQTGYFDWQHADWSTSNKIITTASYKVILKNTSLVHMSFKSLFMLRKNMIHNNCGVLLFPVAC